MNTQTQTSPVQPITEQTLSKSQSPSETFGQGRYSNQMKEVFRGCVDVLGLPEGQARKVAKSYGADLGRLENGQSTVRFGALAKKDRTLTLKESVTIKGVTLTKSLSVVKTMLLAKEMLDYGASVIEVTFQPQIVEWLTDGKE